MSDSDEEENAPRDITDIEVRDVESINNRRINNDQEVAYNDECYRRLTELKEREEIMEAKKYDAANALLRLSRKPHKVKTEKTIKKTIQRPLMRGGKTKKKRKRKKGKSHKKKKISRRGKK